MYNTVIRNNVATINGSYSGNQTLFLIGSGAYTTDTNARFYLQRVVIAGYRIHVTSNTLNSASTLSILLNGAVMDSLSIPAGGTGLFVKQYRLVIVNPNLTDYVTFRLQLGGTGGQSMGISKVCFSQLLF